MGKYILTILLLFLGHSALAQTTPMNLRGDITGKYIGGPMNTIVIESIPDQENIYKFIHLFERNMSIDTLYMSELFMDSQVVNIGKLSTPHPLLCAEEDCELIFMENGDSLLIKGDSGLRVWFNKLN